jgi:integrase
VFFEEYDQQDGFRVWLSQDEVKQLLNIAPDSNHRLAFELGARCGLRSEEIINVSPSDIKATQAGDMLRVHTAKSGGIRQVPIPPQMVTRIDTIDDIRSKPSTDPLITSSKRTLRRWIRKSTSKLADQNDEEMWSNVTMHDLRRTWATALKGEDVNAMIVCDWGGWSDLETFLEHYRGKFSPEVQKKQRSKVSWLS